MGVSVYNLNLQQRIQPAAIKVTSIYRNTAAMARENGGEGKTSKAGAPQRKALETIRGNTMIAPRGGTLPLKKALGVSEPLSLPAHIPVVDDDVEMESPVKLQEVEEEEVGQFPAEVADIDGASDGCNPQLCVEYASAIYSYLRRVEDGLSIREDFLQGCPVNGKMRAVLVDWLGEVHSQFKLLQETLYMTVYVIDKFLQSEGSTIRREKLQLVGVTAMFIASKVEEIYSPEINDFVYITDNAYTGEEIRQMVLRMLRTLGFNFSRPHPLHFLRRNSKAGDVDVLQHTLAKYLVEISLPEYTLAHIPPSLLASAALYLSLMIQVPGSTLTSVWSPTLQYYSTYRVEDVLPVVSSLASVLTKRGQSKLSAVHTKYCSREFMKVAEMPELAGEMVRELARMKPTQL